MSRHMSAGTKASVARQRERQWRAIGQAARRQWRAKAIARGEIESIFRPYSKRPTDGVRDMIDAAIDAGRVTKVPRGVSGIDCGS